MNSQELMTQLNWRYATKAFDPTKKIFEDTLSVLLESMRLAPSSFGLQGRGFVVVENNELRQKLLPYTRNQSQIVDASHLIVLCRRTDVDTDFVFRYLESIAQTRGVEMSTLDHHKSVLLGFLEAKDEQQLKEWLTKQVYIPLGFLLSSCAILSIDSCPMEGFDAHKYNEVLELKEHNLESCVIVPVGYRKQDDKYAHLPKVRNSLDKLIIRK